MIVVTPAIPKNGFCTTDSIIAKSYSMSQFYETIISAKRPSYMLIILRVDTMQIHGNFWGKNTAKQVVRDIA